MKNDLKNRLGVDEWLELIREDKNLNGAYISICQYVDLTEKENKRLKEAIDKTMDILEDNFVYDYVRSCDSPDGVGYDEIDTEHFTYKIYEMLEKASDNEETVKCKEIIKNENEE